MRMYQYSCMNVLTTYRGRLFKKMVGKNKNIKNIHFPPSLNAISRFIFQHLHKFSHINFLLTWFLECYIYKKGGPGQNKTESCHGFGCYALWYKNGTSFVLQERGCWNDVDESNCTEIRGALVPYVMCICKTRSCTIGKKRIIKVRTKSKHQPSLNFMTMSSELRWAQHW